jgi:hypothetical protein
MRNEYVNVFPAVVNVHDFASDNSCGRPHPVTFRTKDTRANENTIMFFTIYLQVKGEANLPRRLTN